VPDGRGWVVAGAVLAAFPFGWGLGLVLAYVIAGKDFGQLPALTVPVGLIAALVFALWPSVPPRTRLTVLVAGALMFIVFAQLVA
jgi:hypothetical protein